MGGLIEKCTVQIIFVQKNTRAVLHLFALMDTELHGYFFTKTFGAASLFSEWSLPFFCFLCKRPFSFPSQSQFQFFRTLHQTTKREI